MTIYGCIGTDGMVMKNQMEKSASEKQKSAPPLRGVSRAWLCLIIVLLLAVTLLAFGVSLNQRAPWFGHATISMAGWMSAGTSLLANQWYREGPLKLGFAMYWEPLSIETSKLAAREPYISFPPGAIVPVYLLAKGLGREPTPAMCMAISLTVQFLVAWCLSLIVLLALIRMGYQLLSAFLFALIPMALYLWLPSPYYQHHMAFFSDQAVMLPFAALILLELCRNATQRPGLKRFFSLLMGLLSFCAVLTDWLFVFVLVSLFLLRLYRGELGKSLAQILLRTLLFWLPALLAIGLFAAQLWYLDAFDRIFGRFLVRSGAMAAAPKDLSKVDEVDIFRPLFSFKTNNFFWQRHFPAAFGPLGAPLLVLSIAFAALAVVLEGLSRWWKHQPHPVFTSVTTVAVLSMLPCLLYYQVFKSHCAFWMHTFTALKFALPLALVAFAVLPASIAALFQRPNRNAGWFRRFIQLELAALMLLATLLFLYSVREERASNFGKRSLDYIPIARFVGEHTDYEEVVFSPDYAITDRPPQLIAYSMKKVYKVDSLKEIHSVLKPLEAPYILTLLIENERHIGKLPGLPKLLEHAYVRYEQDGMILAKIRKKDFLNVYEQLPEALRAPQKRRFR